MNRHDTHGGMSHETHAHAHVMQGAGHDKHAGHSVEMFRSKFFVSLALTIPILALGHMLPRALGVEPLHFPGSAYVAPVLGTGLYAYGGWVFIHPRHWSVERDRR